VSVLLGLELHGDVVDAVAISSLHGRVRDTASFHWDPLRPDAVVAALRTHFGRVSAIALAPGLAFLHPKRLKLPPVAPAERRRIIRLEPDRFFALPGPLAVAVAPDSDIAFAMDAALLESWLSAFSALAPVASSEPGPTAVARALPPGTSAVIAAPAAAGEHGLVEVRDGRILAVRRTPAGLQANDATTVEHSAAAPRFGAATAAARGMARNHDVLLATPAFERQLRTRATRRLATSAALCALAMVLALWSADRQRQRVLDRVTADLATLTDRTSHAATLRDLLADAAAEAAAIRAVAGSRSDQLVLLGAISEVLPPDAVVSRLRTSGADWQIDGTAADAASLVALLDSSAVFEDVRMMTGSTRFREDGRIRESFSIGFRVQDLR
jgi:hypothetical protein